MFLEVCLEMDCKHTYKFNTKLSTYIHISTYKHSKSIEQYLIQYHI